MTGGQPRIGLRFGAVLFDASRGVFPFWRIPGWEIEEPAPAAVLPSSGAGKGERKKAGKIKKWC